VIIFLVDRTDSNVILTILRMHVLYHERKKKEIRTLTKEKECITVRKINPTVEINIMQVTIGIY